MSRRSRTRRSLEESYEIGEYGINIDRFLKRSSKDYDKIKESRRRRKRNYMKRRNGYYIFRRG